MAAQPAGTWPTVVRWGATAVALTALAGVYLWKQAVSERRAEAVKDRRKEFIRKLHRRRLDRGAAMLPFLAASTDFCDAQQRDGYVISADTELVGVLFTASWCPPCQDFVPRLIEMYNELLDRNEKFEVLLVSADESEDDMWAYMRNYDMPWLACRHAERLPVLQQFEGVESIPTLIICDANGNVVTKAGVDDVRSFRHEAFYKWRAERSGSQFLTEEQARTHVAGLSPLLAKLKF